MIGLGEYGFFELDKLKTLKKEKQGALIEILCQKSLSYRIAMLDHLGFINHLEKMYATSKYKMFKTLASIINEGKNERGVKANISTLSLNSNEDKKKYTAHIYKETVIKDYQILK